MEQIRALKATPVPMALGEVMPALQQGTLDSVMSDIPVFQALKYYSVAKYLLATEHALLASITVVSRKWYDALSPDLQKAVDTSGRRVSENLYQWAIDDVKKGYEEWVKSGGELVRLDPKAQERLMAQLLPLGAEVTSKRPDEKAMFELLQDAVRRTR